MSGRATKSKGTKAKPAAKKLVRFVGVDGTHPFHAPIVVFQFARSRRNVRPTHEGLRAGTKADLEPVIPTTEDPNNGWFLVSDDEAATMREEIREEYASRDEDGNEILDAVALWKVAMQESAARR